MPKKLSAKPTVYCIDGSNLVRSSWSGGLPEADDAETADFLQWLGRAAGTGALASSSFRVVFDGSYRNPGRCHPGNIKLYFSEGERADELLLEQASFLKTEETRTVLVTSDRALMERAKAGGISCIWCDRFIDLCRQTLSAENR
ncbi:MAG: hypothetical protein ABIG11_04425 [bacterium]